MGQLQIFQSSDNDKGIYTIGTSDRTFEDFLSLLKQHGIQIVVDVRSYPGSKRFPQFSRKMLEKELAEADMAYVFMGILLGGFRPEGFEEYMKSDSYRTGIRALEKIALQGFSAVLCAEKFPQKCHRMDISQTLAEKGWTVIHIIDNSLSEKLKGRMYQAV